MNLAATIAKMRAAGMTSEAILSALECVVVVGSGGGVIDEQAERRRASDRARKAAWTSKWGEIRALVLSVYQPFCVYCGIENPNTVDHVVPVSAGGVTDLSNLVPACGRCNSAKRDRDMREWLACR